MTQIMVDCDLTKFTVPVSLDRATFKVYDAEAKRRGMEHAGVLIEALLADWPAVLAPVAPKGAVVEAQDFSFGGTF
jgi:hypothetical protein